MDAGVQDIISRTDSTIIILMIVLVSCLVALRPIIKMWLAAKEKQQDRLIAVIQANTDVNASLKTVLVGGFITRKVWKLNKSDLSKVSESIDYGGTIYSITSDDNYLYVGGDTQKVYKLSKSDLSKVEESISYGGTIRSITSDDNFIYVGGDTQKVWKLTKVAYIHP